MENETKITVKLPADLLAAVKDKAGKNNLTVSALVRKFFLAYISDEETSCKSTNAIYNYKEVAKRKRELKEAIKYAHEDFNERQIEFQDFFRQHHKESIFVANARKTWKYAVAEYKAFCEECKRNKFN